MAPQILRDLERLEAYYRQYGFEERAEEVRQLIRKLKCEELRDQGIDAEIHHDYESAERCYVLVMNNQEDDGKATLTVTLECARRYAELLSAQKREAELMVVLRRTSELVDKLAASYQD
jgi:hypothetical protein